MGRVQHTVLDVFDAIHGASDGVGEQALGLGFGDDAGQVAGGVVLDFLQRLPLARARVG